MIYFVDIDNTICYNVTSDILDYSKAIPIKEDIAKINRLYDEGHTIKYWSSRGVGTGKDWLDVTLSQFEKWGVKYSSVSLNKPIYDKFICDKSARIEEL